MRKKLKFIFYPIFILAVFFISGMSPVDDKSQIIHAKKIIGNNWTVTQKIKPCKTFRLDISGLGYDNLNEKTIELRIAKDVLLRIPCNAGQFIYDIDSNTFAPKYPNEQGFVAGRGYQIYIRDGSESAIWGLQIYIKKHLFTEFSFWNPILILTLFVIVLGFIYFYKYIKNRFDY